MFTVFALMYGDHPALARRCLSSIREHWDPTRCKSLRVGMNAVSPETAAVVRAELAGMRGDASVLLYDASPHNRLKYPLMRKMFYDPAHPVRTSFVMWFDDDSALPAGATQGWWARVAAASAAAGLVGVPYGIAARPAQVAAVMTQPWCRVAPAPNKRFIFVTGGWWVADFEVLRRWNYPWPELRHNGGDVMMGELVRQCGRRLVPFTDIRVNADDSGKPSTAPRRGASLPPLWADYKPGVAPDLTHNDFEIAAEVIHPGVADEHFSRSAAHGGAR